MISNYDNHFADALVNKQTTRDRPVVTHLSRRMILGTKAMVVTLISLRINPFAKNSLTA